MIMIWAKWLCLLWVLAVVAFMIYAAMNGAITHMRDKGSVGDLPLLLVLAFLVVPGVILGLGRMLTALRR